MSLVGHILRLFVCASLSAWVLSGCVQDVAVGRRAAEGRDGGGSSSTGGTNDAGNPDEDASTGEDAGAWDSGSGSTGATDAGVDSGTVVTCTPADCNPSLVAPTPCPQGQSHQCVPDNGGCAFLCRPELGPVCGATRCAAGQVCSAPIGTCDPTNPASTCVDRPGVCVLGAVSDAVCSCSGKTYQTTCDALSAGEQISQAGECIAPQLVECVSSKCAGAAPNEPTALCADGSMTGATCAEASTGCTWVVRKCPSTNNCPQPTRSSFTAGQCWNDADCASPKTCVGASVCPCDAKCLVADTPGKCM